MGRRIVSNSCHPTERKNNDFAPPVRAAREALHRIWYALRRWRLVSRRIVLFPTTACSSINRR
ncbi:unnamed protein product [Spirodela intermedia]|uniref:Uncharacterized protein n=1 Tax=Spirodela intermedia TaxID=51605 RepID=A0A7I8I8N6_SPIIN|nr:unnamed protein product [Spirodela intermedia]CAA6654027.1 unnamed protein product [Spirodela intermedia]